MKALFASRKDKPKERFYLFPGQSGRAWRRKQVTFLKYSIIVGILAAAVLAAGMVFFAQITRIK